MFIEKKVWDPEDPWNLVIIFFCTWDVQDEEVNMILKMSNGFFCYNHWIQKQQQVWLKHIVTATKISQQHGKI